MSNSLIADLKKALTHFRLLGPWVFLGRIYLMMASLLLSVIFARMLSVEEYGTYKYILSVFSLMAIFSLTETSQVVVRYVPRGYECINGMLLALRLKYSLIGSCALLLLGVYYLHSGEVGFGLLFLGLTVVYPIYFSFQLFDPYMQSKLWFKRLNAVYIIRTTIQIFSVIIVYILTQSIYLAAFCMLFSIAVVNLLVYLSTSPLGKAKVIGRGEFNDREISREALTLSLIGLLPVVVEQLDKVLIAQIASYEALALFSIGVVFGRAINGFFKPFISTLNAKLVHRTMDLRHFCFAFIFGSLIGMFFSASAPSAIVLLYGESYAVSVHYAQVILMSLGLYVVHALLYNQSMFNKQSSLRKIYANNLVIPLFSLVYLALVVSSGAEQHVLLMYMAFLYPLKMIFSIIALLLMGRVEWFNHVRASA
jgi:O-antigen/teichoic acid export membrane protein